MASSNSKKNNTHINPSSTAQRNTNMVSGVVIPNLTKIGTYAENISNNGGTVDFIDQYRATNN